MSQKRSQPSSTYIANFSRQANFDAAVAEPELEEDFDDLDALEDISEEEEEEGEQIIEELAAAGDIDALEDVIEVTAQGLEDQVRQGLLSPEEAQAFLDEQVAQLEELLALNAEDIPEEGYLDEYDDEELEEEAELEGEEILGDMYPEEIEEVFEACCNEIEADLRDIDAALEAGEIDEEEADELEAELEEFFEELCDEYNEIMELFEDAEAAGYDDPDDYEEDYYDPLVEELEDLRAEVAYQRQRNDRVEAQFSQANLAQGVSEQLDHLERRAEHLVQSGIMPPLVFEREFGAWENERDRFAGFSAVFRANGMSGIEDELRHKERVLEMFEDFADMGTPLYAPGLMAQEAQFSAEEWSEWENEQAQANRNLSLLF
ncbi:MAG TPA: hypothetical protein V6D33_12560 [Cyanophyceae cyanobacterium]